MQKPTELLDWRDFVLEYPWIGRQFLVEKYGIKPYDYDNFISKHDLRERVSAARPSQNRTPEEMQDILKPGWKYYLEFECGLDFSRWDDAATRKLLNLRQPSLGPFSFLVNFRHVENAYSERFRSILAAGYTTPCFAVFHCYPGREFIEAQGIQPFMFAQTNTKVAKKISPVTMLEHLYLGFFNPGRSFSPESMKRRFIYRHDEPGFLLLPDLTEYGLTGKMCKELGGLREVSKRLAAQYQNETNTSRGHRSWNRDVFRGENPNGQWERCAYCQSPVVDLHHLLERATYPHLTYDRDNVVPRCVMVHSYITRNQMTEDEQGDYRAAQKRWLRAARRGDGKAAATSEFTPLMEQLHRSAAGFGLQRFVPIERDSKEPPRTEKDMAVDEDGPAPANFA